jgi:pimeloyl-ACP methyl ester carboxylesterase
MDGRGKVDYDEIALIHEVAAELGVLSSHRTVERIEWERDDRVISGLRWGRAEPAVVLLHGGALNSHSWDAMLLLHDIPALALDLPGHGLSSWFEDPVYLPRRVADAMAPAIADLAPRANALIGHSLGGLASLALAARRPDLVRRLVIVDATPGSTPDRSRDILELAADTEFDSLESAVQHTLAQRPNRTAERIRRGLLHNARQRADGRWTWRHDTRPHPSGDRWEMMFEELPSGWEDAAAVRCPTLLIQGSRSRIVLDQDVDRYRQVVADLRVTRIEDAGHNVHGDQPAALGAAIVAFLRETGAATGGE